MNLKDMSVEELRDLKDKCSVTIKEKSNKAIKEGYLKHDLYDMPSYIYLKEYRLLTLEERNETLEKINKRFNCVLIAGTKFLCYIINGEESWFDNVNYGCENMNYKWAEKHLQDIKEIIYD